MHNRSFPLLRATAVLCVATQLLSQTAIADAPSRNNLATPKITKSITHLDHSLSAKIDFAVCSALRELHLGRINLDEANVLLAQAYAELERELSRDADDRLSYAVGRGPLQLINYKNTGSGCAASLVFQGKKDKVYSAVFDASTNEYYIEITPRGAIFASDEAPLIGHGMPIEQLNRVKVMPWKESKGFASILKRLEKTVRTQAPPAIRGALLETIRMYKERRDGRSLGVAPARYIDTRHYYAAFGTTRSVALGTAFLDPDSPLGRHAEEALFHEIFHACVTGLNQTHRIVNEGQIHGWALRSAAVMYWGLSETVADSLPVNILEHHAANELGKAIRDWKKDQQGLRDAMLNKDPYYLRAKLQEALKEARGDPTASSLYDLISVCEDAWRSKNHAPIESRYPFLQAVSLLSKRDKDAFVRVLKALKDKMQRFVLVDSALLNLTREVPDGWLAQEASDMEGRNIYVAAAEILNAGGGLGRVEQPRTAQLQNLVRLRGRVRTVEPHYAIDKKGNAIDYDKVLEEYNRTVRDGYDDIPEEDRHFREIFRFEVKVDDENTALAVVSRAMSKDGIWRYIIKGYKINESESALPYYTRAMYLYRDEKNSGREIVEKEEFSVFISLAALELADRIEGEEMRKLADEWRPPCIHGNDGQLGLLPYFLLKRFRGRPALADAINPYTTHTYPNRIVFDVPLDKGSRSVWSPFRRFGIPFDDEETYFLHEMMYLSPDKPCATVLDQTSAGVRCADWAGGVSQTHVEDLVGPEFGYDNWGAFSSLEIIGVTNGDIRTVSAGRFIEAAKSVYGDGLDYEEMTSEQVYAARRRAKERANELLRHRIDVSRETLDEPLRAGADLSIDPSRPVVVYGGRGVEEKAARYRALCDENIMELVRHGRQVVMGLNEQREASVDASLSRLFNNVMLLKQSSPDLYPGKFILLKDVDQLDQRVLLSMADVIVQDSDPNTEAAGASEVHGAACGAIVVAPPWPEGLLQAQGVVMDRSGRGNIKTPKFRSLSLEERRKLRRGSYDAALNKELARAYMEAFMELMPPDKDSDAVLKGLAGHGPESIRLSRPVDALLTAAESLRQWGGISEKKARRFPDPAKLPPERRVVMLISGGEAPGVNDYFAYQAIKLAKRGYSLEVVKFGLEGLVRGKAEFDGSRVWINWEKAETIMHMPGASEGTSRVKMDDAMLGRLIENLSPYCGTLIVVGGNNHMDEAKKIAQKSASVRRKMVVIGLPKTIDRDTIDYAIGAMTASRNAHELVRRAYARPGSRRCVLIQMMGRDNGNLAATAAAGLGPGVFSVTREWSYDKANGKATVKFGDIVDAIAARMLGGYKAATAVISEGIAVSQIIKTQNGSGSYEYSCPEDPVLDKVVKNRFLAAKLDNVGVDAHGEPRLSELIITDFIAEALCLDPRMGLRRGENLFVENPGYSTRCTEPDDVDIAVADRATDITTELITTDEGRARVIAAGGMAVAADRSIKTVEDAERAMREKPISDSVGKIDLSTGLGDGTGIYSAAEVEKMSILNAPNSSAAYQPDALTEHPAANRQMGYDLELAVRSINSQSESALNMGKASICVIARPDADHLIHRLMSREPLSSADEYVQQRTSKGVLYIPSDRKITLSYIAQTASDMLSKNGFLNIIISSNCPIRQDDDVLTKLKAEAKTKEMISGLVDGASTDKDGNIFFGERLGDLISLVLKETIGISGARINTPGRVFDLLPEEDIADLLNGGGGGTIPGPGPAGGWENIEAAIQNINNQTNDAQDYVKRKGRETLGADRTFIITRKGLGRSLLDGKNPAIGRSLGEDGRLISQRVMTETAGLIEVETRDELIEALNSIVRMGGRAVILDDDTLTNGLSPSDPIPGVEGKVGEDYCAVSMRGDMEGLGDDTVYFLNIYAMVLMGIGVLNGDCLLFQKAYKAFTGYDAAPGLLADITNRTRFIISVLPRIVRFDGSDLKMAEEGRKLCASAA